MNEIKQLRTRLVQHSKNYEDLRQAWPSDTWLEVENLVQTLDLLDPSWEDELELNSIFFSVLNQWRR